MSCPCAWAMPSTAATALPPTTLGLDQALIWVVIGLLAWGLVMVYSASIAMAGQPALWQDTALPLRRCATPSRWAWALWRPCWPFKCRWSAGSSLAPRIFMLALVLLVMVLIPGVGVSSMARGAGCRWG